jgi:hypothetical protein
MAKIPTGEMLIILVETKYELWGAPSSRLRTDGWDLVEMFIASLNTGRHYGHNLGRVGGGWTAWSH